MTAVEQLRFSPTTIIFAQDSIHTYVRYSSMQWQLDATGNNACVLLDGHSRQCQHVHARHTRMPKDNCNSKLYGRLYVATAKDKHPASA